MKSTALSRATYHNVSELPGIKLPRALQIYPVEQRAHSCLFWLLELN
jgi:hypothetical protein